MSKTATPFKIVTLSVSERSPREALGGEAGLRRRQAPLESASRTGFIGDAEGIDGPSPIDHCVIAYERMRPIAGRLFIAIEQVRPIASLRVTDLGGVGSACNMTISVEQITDLWRYGDRSSRVIHHKGV